MDLFDNSDPGLRPLADRLRPRSINEVAGQSHLLGSGRPLRRALEENRPHSMVLWGPPGSGKTTLARLVAQYWKARFLALSAVLAGVKEIRQAVDEARAERARGVRTVLFVDEAHRFNKAQQDAFLPHIEDGTLIFIGATTENPSFELNNALLSRVRTYVLKPLAEDELRAVLERALADRELGLGGRGLSLPAEAEQVLVRAADGDARRVLNLLEIAADLATEGAVLSPELVAEVATQGPRRFDKGGDAFYDQISALHKSVRGSDPDAALYWLARMLDGGCDPRYVLRRVARMASEDIGNADPQGLAQALAAWEAFERLGSPEGELAIAQAVAYLACAPKSNAAYTAFNSAREDVSAHGSLEVPMHLRNAPTRLMQELGHGKGYRYAHDEPGAYAAGENYLPVELQGRRYYQPVERGFEASIIERLREWRSRKPAKE